MNDKWESFGPQELQRYFDISRGFEELPFSSLKQSASVDQDDKSKLVSQLEFATLGAVGEVGEFAGLIKKWRRKRAFSEKAELQLEEMAAELGDIYAYLLKMANVLGRDLEQVHLERIIRNIIRFEPTDLNTNISVSIAGPSCAGKTTAVTNVAKDLGSLLSSVFVEQYQNNPYLAALFKDQGFDCDRSQKWFLDEYLEFFRKQTKTDRSLSLLDQEPSAVAMVYSYIFFKEGRLESQCLTTHLKQYLNIDYECFGRQSNRKIILLDATPVTLYQRSLTRNQPIQPPISWYSDVRDRFFHIYRSLPNVVYLDTTDLTIENMSNAVAETVRSFL